MRPPTEQRVSDLIDALMTVANGIPNVTPNDGPLRQQVIGRDVLLVGYDSIAVKMPPTDGFDADSYTEQITVPCWVGSWTGDKDLKPRRDRVTEIIGLFRAGLVADVTLGEVVDRVSLGDQTWMPYSNDDGAAMGTRVLVVTESLI